MTHAVWIDYVGAANLVAIILTAGSFWQRVKTLEREVEALKTELHNLMIMMLKGELVLSSKEVDKT